MSSHPKGMPPRQDGLQLDISKADTIVCENCGNASFIQAFFLKKISALMSPTLMSPGLMSVLTRLVQ